MAIDTVRDVLGAVPGATPTSTYRDPATNRRVGGAANSFHTRGTPDNPRAVDLVPAPGESMDQLEARLRSSGLNTTELLNEGDHIHVAVDGQPREQGAPGQQPGYRVESSEDLAPGEAQRLLASGEYQIDPNDPTKIFRVVGYDNAPMPPTPLDSAYAERQAARESLALDQEEAQIIQAAMVPQAVLDGAGAVAGDVAKGVLLEGGGAVLSGVKRGFNATMDLIDETGDWIEQYVPGTVMWEGFDGDASTPMSIRLTTQNEAERRMTEARGGDQPNWLQRLGMAQLRAPVSEAERPESVTGRLIEGVSQFATGWIGGGKLLQGWKTAGNAGRIGKAMAQGALADFTAFDGQEERLSNLLAEHAPEALAPALNWLAADPNDGEVEGRFKNVIEGTILGGVTDVIGVGIRRLRAAREVRSAARDAAKAEGLQVDPTLAMDEAAARGVEVQAAVREALGNPEGPRFTVRKFGAFAEDADAPVITPFQAKVDAADAAISAADVRASTDNVFDINLARMNVPEDIQATIVGMADLLAKDVDLMRRGTRSWDQTREAAPGVDWVDSMGSRRVGQAMNAEEITAYRLALNSSATKLDELSSALLDTTTKRSANEDLALQFALRRAAATHSAIQNEFFGARAEAGRALNAFKIPADAPATYLRQIDSLLADAGGQGTAKDLARYIREAKAKGDVALNQMVRGGAMARSRDIIKLFYTNSLLSGLGTPIVNAVGTPIAMLYHVAARAVSPRLAGAFGGTAETQIGEASALVAGYIQATRDVFKLNPMEAAQRIGADNALELRSKGLFRGMAPGIDDAGDAMGLSLRSEREEAGAMAGAARPIGAAAWRVAEDTPLGRFLDIMQMIVEAPSNITGVTDDFWKVVSARGELHAQALRMSAREGLQGEAARARMADLIENPTDDMMVGAEKAMHELTFTRSDGEAEKLLQKLRRMADDNIIGPVPLATFILPFLRTPMNLMSLAARSSPLAPFSARFRASMRAGGAEAETAKAQAAVGTALWSVWMGMAMDGQITGSGPSNTEQRAAMMREDEYGNPMWQPYSVKQGGRWYSYERMDPVGSNLSLIGDFAELLNNDDWDGANMQEGTEIAANAVLALGQAYFDKSMLQGAIEFTSAMTSNDVSTGERFLMGRASALVPASGASRMLRRGQDPYMRETHNALDALRNTVPLLSDDLPLQRDLWGRPRTYQTGLGTVYDAIMPVQTRAEGGSAIDLEILNNGVGVAMPARSLSYAGETVSLKNRPDIYSEFLRLSGEPAFEHLNAVAEGRHPDSEFYYSLDDGPSGGKAQYIKDVMSAYRDEARAAVSEMFASDLQVMAADKVRRREEARSAE
jgi:hypothetical protein